jgi:hypothetical protein
MPRQGVTAVLDLARSNDWTVALIVGGGLTGTPGEVVGGDEPHWRAFADRETESQLHEALGLMQSLAFAA